MGISNMTAISSSNLSTSSFPTSDDRAKAAAAARVGLPSDASWKAIIDKAAEEEKLKRLKEQAKEEAFLGVPPEKLKGLNISG
jgi:hypothetical protein